MRKILLFVFIFTSLSLHAQRFNGGLLFGLNGSQVDGDTYSGYNKLGFSLGAYVYTPISKITDIQLEIKYSGKGARNNPTKAQGGLYVNQLNYIEVPVILRFKTGTKIDLEGGLAYGYLFKNTMKNDYGSLEINDLFKTSDFSGLAGILYKTNKNISIAMRVSYSLLTIRNDISNIPYLKSRGVYNNVLSIILFYDFNSKRRR